MFLPDDVGFPVGVPGESTFVLLETHYDNPSQQGTFIILIPWKFPFHHTRFHTLEGESFNSTVTVIKIVNNSLG